MIIKKYDVIIIGSGTAGQTAAYELAAEGLSVALVEQSDSPGGVCALRGCQAKKWFYEVTEVVARSRHLQHIGVTVPPLTDWREILNEKNRFTSTVPESTVKALRGNGVEYLKGSAQFVDGTTLQFGETKIQGRYIVVATGAKPMDLPFEGQEYMATSSDFLELREVPPRIAFIGGGFISFEFAHFVARLGGKSGEIHILETESRPLGSFDGDMVDQLVEASEGEGIVIHTDITVFSLHKQGPYYQVELASGDILEVDLVVNGAGRAPNISSLNLEAAGVEFSKKGITTDPAMRTSNPAVFSAGDCTDSPQLARVSDMEARIAVKAIMAAEKGGEMPHMDYSAVPAVLFTYPQLGMVGKTEEQLRQENIKYWKSHDTHLDWTTYRRVGMKHAAYKILVDENDQVLGAHFLADNTTGLVNTFKQAMLDKSPISKVRDDNILSPYPSRESDILYMLGPLLD